MSNSTVKLPNGHDFLTRVEVTGGEATGLTVSILEMNIVKLADNAVNFVDRF